MVITTWKQLVYDYVGAYKELIKDDTPIAVGDLANKIRNLKLITFNTNSAVIGSAYLKADTTNTPIDIFTVNTGGSSSPTFPYTISAGTLITEDYTINGNSGDSIDNLKVQHKDVVPGINPITVFPDEGYHYLTSVKVTAIPKGTLAIESETNDSKTVITAYPSTAGYVDSTDAVTLEIAAEAPTMADVKFIRTSSEEQSEIGLQINSPGYIDDSNKPENLTYKKQLMTKTLTPKDNKFITQGFGFLRHEVYTEQDELTITPTTETQVFEATDAFYTKVTVNPASVNEDLTELLDEQNRIITELEEKVEKAAFSANLQGIANIFNFNKVSVDKFILTEDTDTRNYNIVHSLGEEPKFAYLVVDPEAVLKYVDAPYNFSTRYYFVNGVFSRGTSNYLEDNSLSYLEDGYCINVDSNGDSDQGVNPSASTSYDYTSNTMIFGLSWSSSNSVYFAKNIEYTLITMA